MYGICKQDPWDMGKHEGRNWSKRNVLLRGEGKHCITVRQLEPRMCDFGEFWVEGHRGFGLWLVLVSLCPIKTEWHFYCWNLATFRYLLGSFSSHNWSHTLWLKQTKRRKWKSKIKNKKLVANSWNLIENEKRSVNHRRIFWCQFKSPKKLTLFIRISILASKMV